MTNPFVRKKRAGRQEVFDRDCKILQLLDQGYTPPQIAKQLKLSPHNINGIIRRLIKRQGRAS